MPGGVGQVCLYWPDKQMEQALSLAESIGSKWILGLFRV